MPREPARPGVRLSPETHAQLRAGPSGGGPDEPHPEGVLMSEPTRFDEDPDPTGVRILLASQPDPGPMPADVSDLILAAFAEAGRRADLDADTGSQELSDELGLGVDAFDDFANLVAGQGVSGVDESGPAVPLHLVGRGTQPAGTSSETSGARTDVRTGSPSGSRSGAGMRGRVVCLLYTSRCV